MLSPDASEALFAALKSLRSGDRGALAAWRAIDRYLSAKLPGARHEDLRQAVLLAIHRGADRMQAEDAAGAAAWVRAIVRHKKIDAARAAKSRRALSLVTAEGGDVEIASEGIVTVAESTLGDLLADVEAALDRVLSAEHPRALDRILPRVHAQARLLRAMGHGVTEIRAELAIGHPRAAEVTDAAISKWIERGLPLLSRAIEAWRAEVPDERAEIASLLLERVALRRTDAGKPRISRRKAMNDEPVSVTAPPRRRSRRRRRTMARRLAEGGMSGRPIRRRPSARGTSRATLTRARSSGAGRRS